MPIENRSRCADSVMKCFVFVALCKSHDNFLGKIADQPKPIERLLTFVMC